MTASIMCYLYPPRAPRWKAPAGVALLSFSLHASTLRGTFVWDDRPAVVRPHPKRTAYVYV